MKDPDFSDNGEGAIDFSEILPDQFIVTDKEIDQELYEQFMTEQEWIDPQPDYTILVRQGKELLDSTMPISEKKIILAQLASWGTAEAYQLLRQYCARPDSALAEWSRIALYECRMRLESDLLDVPVG